MAVTLKFCGAARTVTGSCYLFETPNGRFLVDCGMFQGPKTLKELNYGAFPFRAAEIDAVLLTHAHIDHCGLLPKLVRDGFRGTILANRPTIDLCSVMLPDAGHIQESEVEQLNRRNVARGRREVTPIYTVADAMATLDRFRPVDDETWMQVLPGARARWWNAGHMLGSASIEIEIADGDAGAPLRVLMSGDLGPDAKALQPDPAAPAGFDVVVCESTYGDTDRKATTMEARRDRLAAEVRDAAEAGGALLIPAFAVERTQEIVLDLLTLMQRGDVPQAPVFVDSPLAVRSTEIFRRHAGSLEHGAEFERLLRSPLLQLAETVDDSKRINRVSGFHVVVAASGMCEAGRIRHHLKRWLWRKEATVLFVGFQAQGTLGRFLEDGATAVRIQGEEVKVAARMRRIDEYSGHADGPEVARWISERRPVGRAVFLVHGEEQAIDGLEERIAGRIVPAAQVFKPVLDDVWDLSTKVPTSRDGHLRRRLPAEAVVRLDWHNDLSRLILDINAAVDAAADDRAKGVVLRRLRRALNGE